VGYFGGVGFLTLYKEYLKDYRLDENMLDIFRQTIHSLRQYQVDIVLGNHPYHNCTLEKREAMLEGLDRNPFINPQAWQIFLQELEERRLDFEQLGY
jgi:metallo-beta-lactamase class B